MAHTLSEYYTDELRDWNDSIVYYHDEMAEFTMKLGDVIRRNSIADIAAKVESHQNLINQVAEKFYKLQMDIQQQEALLKTDSTYIEDTLVNADIEKKQNELRTIMHNAEKEYIDVKFDCYNFLSGTLRKK